MNRFWQWHFGRGLVNTGDDFGTQGEPPSHPELLDWLASEFRDSGWRMKRLHKLIVMSATYRQSSAARSGTLPARSVQHLACATKSPAFRGRNRPRCGPVGKRPAESRNWRQERATAATPEVAALSYAGSVKWVESSGVDRYRRGLYTWFQRTSPYPSLMSFDAPDSNLACTAPRTFEHAAASPDAVE